MAEHLLTLPPASRVNTVHMMRQMRPEPSPDMKRLAVALHEHGAKSDLMESRAAFARKTQAELPGLERSRGSLPPADAQLPPLGGTRQGEGISMTLRQK
jgi:hypothetical protein